MKTQKDRVAQLTHQAKKGNKQAFEELYKLTSSKAYFVALRITGDEHEAEDILQESYITALSKLSSLESEDKFQSWLNRMVANKSKDFLKKKKPSVFADDCTEIIEALPEENTEFAPEISIDKKELHETVMEVVGELSEDKRACVMMMYFEQIMNEAVQKSAYAGTAESGTNIIKLKEKTASFFCDFKAYFADAVTVTARNSYAGTKRIFGYGLDLFITLIKIAAENIIKI